MEGDVSKNLEEPIFLERWWLPPIYIFSGAFILDGTGVTPDKIANDLQLLYEAIRKNRGKKWPCLLAQFFLVPVYCAPSFQDETLYWLNMGSRSTARRKLQRLGIIMKPVLYNTEKNVVEFREAVQNWNLNYYSFLVPLYIRGIFKAANHFGHKPVLKGLFAAKALSEHSPAP
jgi:hypothetical protein